MAYSGQSMWKKGHSAPPRRAASLAARPLIMLNAGCDDHFLPRLRHALCRARQRHRRRRPHGALRQVPPQLVSGWAANKPWPLPPAPVAAPPPPAPVAAPTEEPIAEPVADNRVTSPLRRSLSRPNRSLSRQCAAPDYSAVSRQPAEVPASRRSIATTISTDGPFAALPTNRLFKPRRNPARMWTIAAASVRRCGGRRDRRYGLVWPARLDAVCPADFRGRSAWPRNGFPGEAAGTPEIAQRHRIFRSERDHHQCRAQCPFGSDDPDRAARFTRTDRLQLGSSAAQTGAGAGREQSRSTKR